MSGPSEKGNFSADIGQDVIDEALRSVERHQREEVPADVPADAPPSAPEDAEAAGAVRAELESLKAQLELSQAKGRELMEKLKDEHERALRAAADLDNYKKRAQKEREETQRFGNERLLKDLLPVLDNLDRAMEAAERSPDLPSFQKGVAMTRKLFEDSLARHGVKAFSAKGQPFDPRLHEAMQQVETAEVPPGHVAHELVRGFMLNDRLIRPALVGVATAPAQSQGAPPPAGLAPSEEGAAQGAAPEAPAGSSGGSE